MRWFVISLAVLSASAVANDTILPLFETDSMAVYNRWLWQHRSEYPGFRLVRARAGVEQSPSGWKRPYAISFTDSGTVNTRYVYPDTWNDRVVVGPETLVQFTSGPFVSVREDGDGFAVRRYAGRSGITAYDRQGRKLFDSEREVVPKFRLWFRDTRPSQLPDGTWTDSTQVLNDSGRIVGVLPYVSIWDASSSGDTLFAAASHRGTVVFDRRARVRWQGSRLGTESRVVAISPDGQRVAVVTQDSAVLHDLVTGRDKVLDTHMATAASYQSYHVAWAHDSRRFAVHRADWDSAGSAMLWVLGRDDQAAGPPRKLDSDFSGCMFWTGDTVVLIASACHPDMWKRTSAPSFYRGPCKVSVVTPLGKTKTWTVPGRFGRYGRWHQQGRCFAYADTQMGYYAVFQVPMD